MIHVVVVFYNDSFFESVAKKTSLTKQLKKFDLFTVKIFHLLAWFCSVLYLFLSLHMLLMTFFLLFLVTKRKTKQKQNEPQVSMVSDKHLLNNYMLR